MKLETPSAIIAPAPEEVLVLQAIAAREQGERSSWQEADCYVGLANLRWTQERIAERCRTTQSRVSKFIACATNYSVLNNRPTFWEAFSDVNSEKKKADPHVSYNSGDNEWYTPAEYIIAARGAMGGIDLDPASTKEANGIVKAERFYTAEQDGLTHPWPGRVWLNPPYSSEWIGPFSDKLVSEYRAKRTTAACVLVNNASETDWFEHIAAQASARCDLHGRVKFWAPDKSVGAPLQGQAVLYLGKGASRFAEAFAKLGRIWLPA
jgi:phage N-6-adenine-methyltransferase